MVIILYKREKKIDYKTIRNIKNNLRKLKKKKKIELYPFCDWFQRNLFSYFLSPKTGAK